MTPGKADPERDPTLAAAFRNGDPEALSRVIDLHGSEIYRFLYFCTRRQDLAEDLTQEVFLRAFSKRHLLVRYNNFRAWLFTIARNIAAKEMKRHHYRLELHLEDVPLLVTREFRDSGPAASSRHQEQEVRQILIEAVNALDGEARELVILRFFSELPLKEIAETLNIPMGSIGGKLNRALLSIRKYFEDRGLSWSDLGPMG